MATNAALTGAVTLALDLSRLTAAGQFTTQDGFPTSESVDLTALLTPATKTAVAGLVATLKHAYQMLRENILPESKFLLTDQSYLSPLAGATVAPDTGLSFVGTQSAKVVTPGAAAGEGVSLALGSVPKGALATVTVMVQAATGVSLTATLTDTANTADTYTAVSPATTPASYTKASTPISSTASVAGNSGTWQAVTLSVVAGAGSAPALSLSIVTSAKAAVSVWLGAVQVQA